LSRRGGSDAKVDRAFGNRHHVEDSEESNTKMEETEVYDYARKLLEARRAQAVVEAAQKACAFEQQGNKEETEPGYTSR
jgi:hypothetical protein